ncbi:DUF1254 domain-containing protein [Sedimentitalea sp.]|uniref:DUF1254 domain-containing protein n=1 Tax=Sedimentitalea sp. TaxID=2048915 RepID=UPI003297978F
MKTAVLAFTSLAVPFAALADPSDVDQFGNPVGYVEMEKDAPVTDDDLAYAMLDLAMEQEAKLGAINQYYHHRTPMELDKQPAVLMNRDTLYSFAIVDASHGLTVRIPEVDGRYISTQFMEHDHTTKSVEYGAGEYVIEPNSTTKFIVVNTRIQVNPNDPEDVAKVNTFQDQYEMEFPEGYTPDEFKVTNWNMDELKALKEKYVKLSDTRGLSNTMGARGEVSLEDRNVGAAAATGLLPTEDAWYSFNTYDVDQANCYTADYAVPELRDPDLGFYSMTIYGDDYYLHTEAGSSLSNHEIALNEDGKTFTLWFGSEETCGAEAQNLLIAPTDNWTTTFRVYMPGESVQNDEYELPEPQPAG